MVKICVISAEAQKEKEKIEGLPAPEILTEIPLYEKLKLENTDDLAAIKNPKRRCKGMLLVMLVLVILVLACVCLTIVVYSRNEKVEEQEVIEHKETRRFEFEITFRDPDEVFFEKEAGKPNFEFNVEIDLSNDIKTTQKLVTKKPVRTTIKEPFEPRITTNRNEPTRFKTTKHTTTLATTDSETSTHRRNPTIARDPTVSTPAKKPTTSPRVPTTTSTRPTTSTTTLSSTTKPTATTGVDTTEYEQTNVDGYTTIKATSHQEKTTTPYQSTVDPIHHMKEEITIGNNTEVFTIPPGEDNEALIFLHDFTYEYTAYLLVDQQLCFIKDLNPFLLHPWGLWNILMNPFYFAHEFIATRETFIAVPPPLYSLWSFGPDIAALCGDAPTFWLEEVMDDNEHDIVDVTELPWFEWGYDRYDRRKRSVEKPKKCLKFFDSDERMHCATINFVKSKD